MSGPFAPETSTVQPDCPAAQPLHRRHVMANKKYGTSRLGNSVDLAQAFFLEGCITDGEHFVDDQNFGLEMCCHSERQADIHSAGITFYGCIDEFLDFSEGDDLIKFA